MSKVKCMECHQTFRVITHTHLKKHGLTLEDYTKKWPGSPLTNSCLCAERSKRAKALHQDPEFRERWISSNETMLRERWSDPEFRERQKIAAAASWEDPDYREKMIDLLSNRWKNPDYRKAVLDGIQRKWGDESYREFQRQLASERWKDPEYRRTVIVGLRAAWKDPDLRRHLTASRQKASRRPTERRRRSEQAKCQWEDPEYRDKHKPFWGRWTKEEITVRGWLERMKLYLSGSKTKGLRGFVGHGWAPTKGAGFSFNADFIDYNFKTIIHVDGWHHTQEETLKRDRRNDRWCDQHGWHYLRLPIADIHKRPHWCKQQILVLVDQSSEM